MDANSIARALGRPAFGVGTCLPLSRALPRRFLQPSHLWVACREEDQELVAKLKAAAEQMQEDEDQEAHLVIFLPTCMHILFFPGTLSP